MYRLWGTPGFGSGPLLFITYINSLVNELDTRHSKYYMYAGEIAIAVSKKDHDIEW